MKILISTLGSRGDTQPYLALAVGLQAAGHRVTLTAPRSFVGWIESYGVRAHAVRFDPQQVMQDLTGTRNPLQALRALREVLQTGVMGAMEDCWQPAQEADFLLQTGTGSNALEIAGTRGIPVAFSYLVPMASTRAFPAFLLPFRYSLGGAYNHLTHTLTRRFLWAAMGGPAVNRWRVSLGLPAWRSELEMQKYARRLDAPSLYGYSPMILPRPQDWDEFQHVCGYWFLDPPAGWQPPAELQRFLAVGPAPVYVGFGSMRPKNAEAIARLVIRALELSGQRGILSTGWGSIARLPASRNVLFVEEVPHAWLFPRMAAVVHHGGAGTTAAGLRAGVPNIISPFGGDQYSWAERVVKIGAGLRVARVKRLRPESLSDAIQTAVMDPALRAGAAEMGQVIRAEDGLGRAVEVIERHAFRTRQ
jgi:sterol 3beta-glucosyltransferase